MKTIGAKELRLHLDQVLDRVLNGEEIIISHRFKGPVKLSPLSSQSTFTRGKLRGLQKFDAASKHEVKFDNNKSIKELYRDSLTEKYGK